MTPGKRHHKLRFVGALPWRHPDAPLELARALGEIAAELWLTRQWALTAAYTVATLSPDEASQTHREGRDDQAQNHGGGSPAVA
jgi:hypothetical protein